MRIQLKIRQCKWTVSGHIANSFGTSNFVMEYRMLKGQMKYGQLFRSSFFLTLKPHLRLSFGQAACKAGADPGFDQGGAPDRYRPKLPTVRSKPGKNRDN